MIVLGIETSCDETAAAIVRDGTDVLSSVVYSQVELHGPYGGVVPEIACRCHVEALPGVIDESRSQAGASWEDIDAVAVTYGPGLSSSLLIGLSAAKGLALRLDKPLCGINHLHAHIYSPFMSEGVPSLESSCPFLALVVSGGHTCLVRADAPGQYRLLGQTIDDAAGEAFDKGATLLGLGYPGGPVMDKAAKDGKRDFVRFPRGRARKERGLIDGMDSDLCFSFSGLKTALMYYVKSEGVEKDDPRTNDVVASYQEAIVDALVSRCRKALGDGMHILAVGGGVSLNSRLRERLNQMSEDQGTKLMLAEPRFCGDNAAMIAALAGTGQGVWGDEAMSLDAEPNLLVAGV
ncbi:MAG: tRNA (adenosine(37)-N6)-threonylcarbamoyltransferase complex transferase subunit TsaD [Kiritimatiellia bacterium]|jgi:N6-L-threonylcarbamoyladenine synthase|nr:tRNA (adenosine(37)-N6)-threonylcarbamoyltransferase complex transferase subunit TsaD [Kiritimatiellia bacterium]